MQSVFKEKQAAEPKAFFLDHLFEKFEVLDPDQRSRASQGIGLGIVSVVIVLNAVLTFI